VSDTVAVPAPAGAGVHDAIEEAVRIELADTFQIEAVLARGARSIVYAARETGGGRAVALRVLARGPLRDTGIEDQVRRTIAAAALDHPHIVPIYRFGTTGRLVWYSMKFLEGRSLHELLRAGGPLELGACLRIVEQVASAIDYAHRRGVVHGDLRPANVLLDSNEWAFVTDFVIGRVLAREPEAAASRAAYAAPEDRAARPPTPAVDQYALAATVYECLTGAVPGDGAVRGRAPPSLADARSDLPGHVSDALARAMHPYPEERFPSVLDFVSALGAAGVRAAAVPPPQRARLPREGQPVLRVEDLPRGPGWMRVAAAALVIGIGGLALVHRSAPAPGPPPLVVAPPAQGSSPRVILPPVPPPSDSELVAAVPEPVTATRETAEPREPPRARQPVARPATVARAADRPLPAPGRLYVSSRPWGRVYVDGRLLGNTPRAGIPIPAGVRQLRIERDGFVPFEQRLVVVPGQEVRVLDVVLEDMAP